MSKLTPTGIKHCVSRALKRGNWIIRADEDGVSYGDFRWRDVGEWTVAPDWDETPECGGGLHGQDQDHGGYIQGSRLVFCDTRGPHVAIDLGNKVKVPAARILLVNALPGGLHVSGDLDLGYSQITALPGGLHVGGDLNLRFTQITELPGDLHVGGDLYLRYSQITALPGTLHVGGSLDLRHTQITELPGTLHVGGDLNLSFTQITALPGGLHVGG